MLDAGNDCNAGAGLDLDKDTAGVCAAHSIADADVTAVVTVVMTGAGAFSGTTGGIVFNTDTVAAGVGNGFAEGFANG